MVRIIVLILAVLAVIWCYNNVNFDNIKSGVSNSVKNEKTIKAVNQTRSINYEDEQNVAENNH